MNFKLCFTFTATLLISSSLLSAAEPDQADFEDAYARSLELLERYRVNQSPALINRTRAQTKLAYEIGIDTQNNPDLLAELAFNYALVATFEEALDALTFSIELTEENHGKKAEGLIWPLIEMANRVNRMNTRSAKPYFIRAAKIAEDYWENEFDLANLYLEIGKKLNFRSDYKSIYYLKKAVKTFGRQVGLPALFGEAEANLYLGKFWMKRRTLKKSEKYLTEAASLLEGENISNDLYIDIQTQQVLLYDSWNKPDLVDQHNNIIWGFLSTEGDVDLRLINSLTPRYPPNAMRLSLSGYVTVSFTVNEKGKVENPRVIDTEGHSDFEFSAIEAIEKFIYTPRFLNGQAVVTDDVQYIFRFTLVR